MQRGKLLRALCASGSELAERLIDGFYAGLDCILTYAGPFYVVCATILIALVAFVFFSTILPEVSGQRGLLHALGHGLFGVALLGNVTFNYYMAIRTHPGSTAMLDPQDLVEASAGLRFCKRCALPKPPLTHHCHICNKCILRMDHHCPWMHNCIGFHNYRYFFLFVFYTWLSCAYGTVISGAQLREFMHPGGRTASPPPLLPFVFILSIAVCIALSVLLGWHVYLVGTGQGTIDFHDNCARWRAARQRGTAYVNEYNLGFHQNFQETFDVQGRMWWLRWMLPSLRPKLGDGVRIPMADVKQKTQPLV